MFCHLLCTGSEAAAPVAAPAGRGLWPSPALAPGRRSAAGITPVNFRDAAPATERRRSERLQRTSLAGLPTPVTTRRQSAGLQAAGASSATPAPAEDVEGEKVVGSRQRWGAVAVPCAGCSCCFIMSPGTKLLPKELVSAGGPVHFGMTNHFANPWMCFLELY